MTKLEFTNIRKQLSIRPKTLAALYDVLVLGHTGYKAAMDHNLQQSSVSRALKRFPRSLCPTCGKPT